MRPPKATKQASRRPQLGCNGGGCCGGGGGQACCSGGARSRQPAPTSFGYAIACTGMTPPAQRHRERGEASLVNDKCDWSARVITL